MPFMESSEERATEFHRKAQWLCDVFEEEPCLRLEALFTIASYDDRVQQQQIQQDTAQKLVDKLISEGGPSALACECRAHFLKAMQPKFPPPEWDIQHEASLKHHS